MKNIMRAISAFVLVSFLSGCIGQFALTKEVYKFNLEASDEKWVDEALFLVFAILPVYQIAVAADAIILNSIEFWTDENPMSKKKAVTKRVHGEDGGYADLTLQQDGSILVQNYRDGHMLSEYVLRKGEGVVTLEDRNQNVLSLAQM